jgi:uncharacterized protein (DUF433 family)
MLLEPKSQELTETSTRAFCGILIDDDWPVKLGEVRMTFQRITVDPEICGGKPCIRGLRFPVSRLLGLLAAGETPESILKSYPYLEQADIQEALCYAALLADEQVIEFA